jgi:hypothetical protein
MPTIGAGITVGPGITTTSGVVQNGLALDLDATSTVSTRGQRTLINWNNWTIGTGGVTGYNQNGSTSENSRVSSTNPFGYTDIVWQGTSNVPGDADGGWNTDWFPIDNTKLYRFSVWVRRTSAVASGTFYFGAYADGSGTVRMDNSTVEGNAYWECSGTSLLTQNQWYLWVGHIYPYNTASTGRNANTGYYTISGGRVGNVNGCNIGSGDLKWSSNSTQGIHRTYLYYSGDATSQLQWWQPRVDLIDGTEPSIQDLLNNAGSTWFDVSGQVNNATMYSLPAFTKSTGYFTFDGSTNYGTVVNNSRLNFASAQTLQIVMRHTYTSGRKNPWNQAYAGYGTWTHENGDTISQYFGNGGADTTPYIGVSSPSTPRSVWNIMCAVRSTTDFRWYINGVLSSTTANPYGTLASTASNITIGNGYAGYWQGDMSRVTAYTRALSDAEVAQNFTAIRGIYGI